MILVIGSVHIIEGKMDDALAASHEHVQRSRSEPGCIEHGVSVCAEAPHRLVFVERWANLAVLKTHFSVPASRHFVKTLSRLSSAPPSMAIYDSTEVILGPASSA